jgi:hypothetical protein
MFVTIKITIFMKPSPEASFRFRRSLVKIRLNVAIPVDELTAKQHGDRSWGAQNCSTKN